MGKTPLLTIAIPTYNRAKYLDECLNSIVCQVNEDNKELIEIFVSDNCSTDDTKKVIDKYSDSYFITYLKNDKNMGPDININNCIYKSSGKFVHLLADDDILLPNTVDIVLDFLKRNSDISLIHLNSCNFTGEYDQNEISEQRMKISKDIVTTDKDKYISYFGIFITFLSTLVLNREKLSKIADSSVYFHTHFLQSHIALKLMQGNEKMGIIAHNSVAARGGNTGGYNLYEVWIYQYKKLLLETGVEVGISKKHIISIFKESLCNEIKDFISSFRMNNTGFDLKNRRTLLRYTYMYPIAWLKVYPYAFLPVQTLQYLQKLKRKLI